MTAPAVVIELPASDRGSPLASALVGACSEGVAGTCALTSVGAGGEGEDAAAVAIVSWADAEHRVARIEVGLRRAVRAEWRMRTVDFRPQDDPVERWRAVGLVIATLVDETVHPRAPSPPPPPPTTASAPSSPLREQPSPSPARHSRERVVLEVGGLLGPGLDSGPWREGGWLRGSYAPGALPLLVTASLRTAFTPSDARGVKMEWLSGAVGMGAGAVFRQLRVQARLEAVAQLVHASVDAGATDSASRWVTGGRLGVDVAWMPLDHVGLTVGTDLTGLAGSTGVHVRGVDVGRSQPLEFVTLVGVRAALW